MTYIEFFDPVATENVSTCLTLVPERVIYIGYSRRIMEQHIAAYSHVFAERGYTVDVSCRTVSKSDLDSAVALLQELVDTYDDCVFDVTGGEEILILALGTVYARNPDRNIQIHKFNLRNNAMYDWDKDGTTVYREPPVLSAEENIRIYGGDLVYGDVKEDKTYLWELTEDFVEDIGLMWSLCRKDVRLWNTQISIFEAAKKIGSTSEDGLTLTAGITFLDNYLARNNASYTVTEVVKELQQCGLLTAFSEQDGFMYVAFKNLQVRRCLTKAGQALEMKVFLLMKGLRDKNGNPEYNDAINGAFIDWDGECHDEKKERIYDTENEVDVLLMHGVIPVFVSCKNGSFKPEELYKLNTVAERFGGPYAKKVLVTTCLSTMGETGAYIRQRATDMKIRVVSDVQELEDAAFAKALKNLWSNG